MSILDKDFNPGAFAPRPDSRAFQYSQLLALGAIAAPAVDWDKGFDCEEQYGFEITQKDQDGSLSCVGQTTAELGQVINFIQDGEKEEKSAKYIYEQIYLPGGGAYLDAGANVACRTGYALEKDYKSYDNGNPPSEDYMRRAGITNELRALASKYDADKYFYITPNNIDELAFAIQAHGAVILGATGSNPGWQTGDIRPPQNGEQLWGHAFLGKGFKKINGLKKVKFQNHWSAGWGYNGDGWIDENYVKSPNFYTPIVLVDKKAMANLIKLVKTQSDPLIYVFGADGMYHPLPFEFLALDLFGPWSGIQVDTVASIPEDKKGYWIGAIKGVKTN